MNAPATFHALVEGTAPATLRGLAEQAITAMDAARYTLHGGGDKYECDSADDEAWQARKRLADFLLTEHGITTAMAKRLGEVLS